MFNKNKKKKATADAKREELVHFIHKATDRGDCIYSGHTPSGIRVVALGIDTRRQVEQILESEDF